MHASLFLATAADFLAPACSTSPPSLCGKSWSQAELIDAIKAVGTEGAVTFARIESELEACPSDEGLLALGFFSRARAGDGPGALAVYRRIVSAGANLPEADAEAGYLYGAQGDYAGAESSFARALASEGAVDLLYKRAEARMRLGKVAAAIEDLEAARSKIGSQEYELGQGIRVGGDNAYADDVGLLLSEAYVAAGEKGKAVEAVQWALGLSPDNPSLQERQVEIE